MMERLTLSGTDWHDPSYFPQHIFPKLASKQVILDFSGLARVERSAVENVIGMVKLLLWDEAALRLHLGVDTMTPEVQRVILPLLGLEPPPRETPQAFSNNPFNQLAEIQRTYRSYVDTFVNVRNDEIRTWLEARVDTDRLLWNEPFLQLRRRFKAGSSLGALITRGLLPPEARRIFRVSAEDFGDTRPIHPHVHQERALELAAAGQSFIVATGTGSGKSFAFGLPVIADALARKDTPGIKAVIIYPMNALANSQYADFALRLHGSGLKIALYTGDTPTTKEQGQHYKEQQMALRGAPVSDAELWSREEVRESPPDILMTNYVQLEYLLTRGEDRQLFPESNAGALRYLVLDEVHTYAGKRGADVACLIRRLKEHTGSGETLRVIGTSATVESGGAENAEEAIKAFGSSLFGQNVSEVIGESYAEGSAFSDTFLPRTPSVNPEVVAAFDGSQAALYALIEGILGRGLNEGEKDPAVLGALLNDYAPLYFLEQQLHLAPQPLTVLAAKYVQAYRPELSEEAAAAELQAALFIGQFIEVAREGILEPRLTLKLHSFYSQGLGVSGALTEPSVLSIKGEAEVTAADGTTVPAFPLVFCRVCGQEYFLAELKGTMLAPSSSLGETTEESYYLRPGSWNPKDEPLPEDWLTPKTGKLSSKFEGHEPLSYNLDPYRAEVGSGIPYTFVKAPFLFCPTCQTHYDRRSSELGKLIPYGMVGRSTATDILLSRTLDLLPQAQRKIIAFVDNRQDTEFQAAHFRDLSRKVAFRQTVVDVLQAQPGHAFDLHGIGTAVWEAWKREDRRPEADELYDASGVTGQAFQRMLKGFAVADLSRSQQPNIQNLEEAGVVRYDYRFLEKLTENETLWHTLAGSERAEVREDYLRGFLDLMRRRDATYDDAIFDAGTYRFKIAQSLDGALEGERFWEPSRPTLFTLQSGQLPPKTSKLSAFTGSKRTTKFEAWTMRVFGLARDEAKVCIEAFVEALTAAKVLRLETLDTYQRTQTRGYLISPNAVRMVLQDTSEPPTLRVCPRSRMICYNRFLDISPEFPKMKLQTRRRESYFFQQYNNTMRLDLSDAKAHSGQVPGEERRAIETRFRKQDDQLNVLVATPTMEMGIDIGALSAVYMRNVPPSPANYAQRSGRAGRKGQSALVQVFCGGGAARGPHDQYFYRFPEKMISGSVFAPRFLLDNKRLIASHIRSLVLEVLTQQTGLGLPWRVPELLNLESMARDYPIFSDQRTAFEAALEQHGERVIAAVKTAFVQEVAQFDWLDDAFISRSVMGFVTELDEALNVWRDEYLQAIGEYETLRHRLRNLPEHHDAYRDLKAEEDAAAQHVYFLRGEGKNGLDLRRFLGGQGFLPNYAFAGRAARVEFRSENFDQLERPPLVALSELAPGNSVYYAGEQYQITRANPSGASLEERSVKRCPHCKRVSLLEGEALDACPACGEDLSLIPASASAVALPIMQAEPRARITSDAEERQRRGFNISSVYQPEQTSSYQSVLADGPLHLTYEHNGKITTVNAGARKTADDTSKLEGFAYCMRCKKWLLNDAQVSEHPKGSGKKSCAQGGTVQDIKFNLSLFVAQRSDVITLEVPQPPSLLEHQVPSFYETLLWALSRGAQLTLELESDEVRGFLLKQPRQQIPYRLVLHETSEGGLGALSSLCKPEVFKSLVRKTLELLHFHDETGCLKACYECLLSYDNQLVHGKLDRNLILPLLEELQDALWEQVSSDDHYDRLLTQCGSSLERRFLETLKATGIRLPERAQMPLQVTAGIHTRADFYYRPNLYVYVDGPPHDSPEQQQHDAQIRQNMLLNGYEVFVLHHQDDWQERLESLRTRVSARPGATATGDWQAVLADLKTFASQWLPLVQGLKDEGVMAPSPDTLLQDLMVDAQVTGDVALLSWQRSGALVTLIEAGTVTCDYPQTLIEVTPESDARDVASKIKARLLA